MSNIEEHIRQAMQEGKFENLPGRGKPLRLDDNPNLDPEWRMAYHLLQSNGFTLPWMERRKELELELQAARTAVQRAWAWRVSEIAGGGSFTDAEHEWQRACSAFRQAIDELNKNILSYNLEAPSERFHIRRVNADRELDLTAQDPSDTLAGTDTG